MKSLGSGGTYLGTEYNESNLQQLIAVREDVASFYLIVSLKFVYECLDIYLYLYEILTRNSSAHVLDLGAQITHQCSYDIVELSINQLAPVEHRATFRVSLRAHGRLSFRAL